jgi:uncharacterized membrane protein YfbV (UPF0208 family)
MATTGDPVLDCLVFVLAPATAFVALWGVLWGLWWLGTRAVRRWL